MEYGLIGEKLGHSYSKQIHAEFADYHYELLPLTGEEFPVFMEKKDFRAINVTKSKEISYDRLKTEITRMQKKRHIPRGQTYI